MISRWSWLTPLMTSSWVWASWVTLTVGSSSAILCSPTEIFCSSPRFFGSTASPNIGLGNVGGGSFGAWVVWAIVSPISSPSTLAMATMSPGPASWTWAVCLP